MRIIKLNWRAAFLFYAGLMILSAASAQNNSDTLKGRNIYNPHRLAPEDTITVPVMKNDQMQYSRDSADARQQFIQDSIQARLKFIQDSIQARLKFIQDSILAREKFIRDSIQRRKRILDSLNLLKDELPRLLDASLKTVEDQIMVYNNKLIIKGDSTLNNYNCIILPFQLNEPYTPWKLTVNLTDNPVKIKIDTLNHKIMSIKSPYFSYNYKYGKQRNIIRIDEESGIVSNRSGKYYKVPFDSVFFDRQGRVAKVKRYIHYYQVTGNYQRGAPLFIHLSQVKQFEYSSGNLITKHQAINFCERWNGGEENKVCNIITYTLSTLGKTYTLSRHNDPANDYASGTFTFEFDDMYNLKTVSFKNIKNTEDWKCFIDLNRDWLVSRYAFENKGVVGNALVFYYHLDDPTAKHKVESISCTFESDGVSYYQRNNTTGKSRERSRITGEWGPWK
jgi:hypothetical protein